MTREELKKAIHFRTLNCSCCGNCKHFERQYEDTICRNRDNCEFYGPDEDDCIELIFPDEHQVCDRFERKEESDNA